jgi:formiminotetrahydrofolate cyclodeaminase
MDLEVYLDELSSAAPTPGGGSAATIVGALGTALLAMVARITLESARLASVHHTARMVVESADTLRTAFLADRPRDEAAYGAVVVAMALPRATEAERAARTAWLQSALTDAAEAPLDVAQRCVAAMILAELAAGLENKHLMSDVECAVRFLRAAFEASAANVRVNHAFMRDTVAIAAQRARLEDARSAIARAEASAATHFAP